MGMKIKKRMGRLLSINDRNWAGRVQENINVRGLARDGRKDGVRERG